MKPGARLSLLLLLAGSIFVFISLPSCAPSATDSQKTVKDTPSTLIDPEVSIRFVTAWDEAVQLSTSFSHPNPVVTIGIGKELRDIKPSDLKIDLKADTMTVHIHGRITCDIADIVPDHSADILRVALNGAAVLNKEGQFTREVAVTNQSPHSLERDYRPQKDDTPAPRPYIGTFECDLVIPLELAGHSVSVTAVNAIGQNGSDSFFIRSAVKGNEQADAADAPAVDVTNNESTDAGICNPIWVYVVDPAITPENVATRHVQFFKGHSFDLMIDGDGRVRTKVPFIQVGRDFTFGKMPRNIMNVETNGASQNATYKHVTESIEFSYTAFDESMVFIPNSRPRPSPRSTPLGDHPG